MGGGSRGGRHIRDVLLLAGLTLRCESLNHLCRCGGGGPSPGADAAAVGPVTIPSVMSDLLILVPSISRWPDVPDLATYAQQAPLPHPPSLGSPLPTSAPKPGSPLPLGVHSSHICTRTWLASFPHEPPSLASAGAMCMEMAAFAEKDPKVGVHSGTTRACAVLGCSGYLFRACEVDQVHAGDRDHAALRPRKRSCSGLAASSQREKSE